MAPITKFLTNKSSSIKAKAIEKKQRVQLLNRGGENTVSAEDVKEWFDDNDADPGYQVLSCEEIVEAVLGGESNDEEEEEEEEEFVVDRPKRRGSLVLLLQLRIKSIVLFNFCYLLLDKILCFEYSIHGYDNIYNL